jgi:hypothetical protein
MKSKLKSTSIILVLTIGLVACDRESSSPDELSSVSTTSPTGDTATFKDISFSVPQGWEIVQGTSITACVPDRENIVILGDFTATGDCPPPDSNPAQIWVTSELPNRTPPTQLQTFGSLQGWTEAVGSGDGSRSVIVLPQQDVDIHFLGSARNQIASVSSTIREP